MLNIKKGDIVVRKSYSGDIYFKVIDFLIDHENNKIAILKGIEIRLCADAPIEDLETVDKEIYLKILRNSMKKCKDQVECLLEKRDKERYKKVSYHIE